jgi:hypothetical protein
MGNLPVDQKRGIAGYISAGHELEGISEGVSQDRYENSNSSGFARFEEGR